MRSSSMTAATYLACVAGLSASVTARPANDACSSAQAIAGFSEFAFDLTGATTDGVSNNACLFFGEPGIDADVWFCWTATESGPAVLETCGLTSIDSKVSVFQGCACPEGSAILACSDDNCSTQTRLAWVAQAGQQYLIRLGVYPGAATGAGTMRIRSGVLAGPIVDPSTGSSYFLIEASTWSGARAMGQLMGGNLATINDAAENEFVRSSVMGFDGRDRRSWIGFTDEAVEGTFVWVSGEPVTFTNWNGGEPNNAGGTEHYAEVLGSNGQWNDQPDSGNGVVTTAVVEIPAAGCYADCDSSTGQGVLDIFDFLCFQNRFASSAAYACECDTSTGPGVCDIFDFLCFQNAFAAGCP